MKTLKEKIVHVTRQHKIKKQNNLRDKTIHIGNLKNIKGGDSIYVYHGNFYTVPKMFEVNFVDFSIGAIYIYMYNLKKFHIYNCKEWVLDSKKPVGSGATSKGNWKLANSNFINLIKYPIINIKYKEKLTSKCIPPNFLCYDIKNESVCKFLSYTDKYYHCNFLHETLFQTDGFISINSKYCMKRKGKQQ